MRTKQYMTVGLLAVAATRVVADNTVLNGDFSDVTNGKPVHWEISGNPRTVTQTLTVLRDDENAFAKLECTRCEGKGGWTHAMLAQVGGVRLQKGKSYRFSCRARGEGIAGGSVSVTIQDMNGWQACGFRTDLSLATSWRTYTKVFEASRTAHKNTRLQFWYTEPGTFFLDDVQIVGLDAQDVQFTHLAPAAASRNLVPNGSFEAGTAGWSSLGPSVGWGNLARLHGELMTGDAADGKRFLRIPVGGNDSPLLHFDYYRPKRTRLRRVLAANLGWIRMQPGQHYTLSCRLRAATDGTRAVGGVRARDPKKGIWDRRDRRTAWKLSTDWKHYRYTFRAPEPYAFVTIGPDLADDLPGHVDVDAVQLEKGRECTAYAARATVEIAVEPSAPAGIFTVGRPASLNVTAVNTDPREWRSKIVFEATDFFDRPARLGAPALEINAQAGHYTTMTVPLPAAWRGYYRVRARWSADGREESRTLHLAFVPKRRSDDSVLGINHAFNTPYLIGLARKAGITWYRDWTLKWEHIEPRQGEYRWDIGDAQIDRVLGEDVHLMALLPPFPSANWISEAPGSIPKKGYPAERLAQAWAPRDPKKLAGYVQKAVARYRNRIRVWEFLNEPLYTTYALPAADKPEVRKYGGKGYTVSDYVKLLGIAAQAMKSADPGCRIMGGIGGGPDTLTREAIEAGCLKHIDIFNIHTYPGGRAPEGFIAAMDRLLARMAERGGRKPIWITEFSYYGDDDPPRRPFIPDGRSWSEQRLLAGERQCAEYTLRFLVVMLSRGVEKVFLHSGASGSVNNPALECCLFRYGGIPRKVFPALAVFTDLVGPAPSFVREAAIGRTGHCVLFSNGSRRIHVLWNPDPTNRATVRTEPVASGVRDEPPILHTKGGAPVLRVGRDAVRLDMMGRPLPAGPLLLGPSPVYVIED